MTDTAKNGNGKTDEAAVIEGIQLDKEEAESIRASNVEIDRVKMTLSDLQIQYEHHKNHLLAEIHRIDEERKEKGKAILRKHGESPDDPGVLWNLRFDTMAFTKQVVEPAAATTATVPAQPE